MRLFLCMLILCAPAWAQSPLLGGASSARSLGGRQVCSAAITANCIPAVDANGAIVGDDKIVRKDAAGNIAIGTTCPGGAPAGSICVGGTIYDSTGTPVAAGGLPVLSGVAAPVDGVTDGETGQLYVETTTPKLYWCKDGAANTWSESGSSGGPGDVVGPASSVDGTIAVFDGVTGKAIKQPTGPLEFTGAGQSAPAAPGTAGDQTLYADQAAKTYGSIHSDGTRGIMPRATTYCTGSQVATGYALDGTPNCVDQQGGADPLTTFDFLDDFVTGLTTNGNVGLGWSFGGGTVSIGGNVAGRPGIMTRSTGATGSTVAQNTPNGVVGGLAAADTFRATWVLRLTTTADAQTILRAGLFCGGTISGTAQPTAGLYFESVGGGNWYHVRRDASAESSTDSTTAMATDTWYRLVIRRVSETQIGFAINGGTEAVYDATNVPTGACTPWSMVTNGTTAAAQTIQVDLFRLTVTGLSR